MKLSEALTEEKDIRYWEEAVSIWGEWEVLWSLFDGGYSGEAKFLVKRGTKEYCYYAYTFGSCSGCDKWEDARYTSKQIENEMKDSALFMNKYGLRIWMDMLGKAQEENEKQLHEVIIREVYS